MPLIVDPEEKKDFWWYVIFVLVWLFLNIGSIILTPILWWDGKFNHGRIRYQLHTDKKADW